MTPHELTLSQIDRIAIWHGVGVKDILSKNKRPNLVAARRDVALYYRRAGKTSTEIGRILERDHTTVLNLIHGKGWKKRETNHMKLPRRAGYSAGLV